MGLRVPENKASAVHGEARALTFCLYTDHGQDSFIELPWDEFKDLERVILELAQRHPDRDWPWEKRGHLHRMAEQIDPNAPEDLTPVVPYRVRPIKKKGEHE